MQAAQGKKKQGGGRKWSLGGGVPRRGEKEQQLTLCEVQTCITVDLIAGRMRARTMSRRAFGYWWETGAVVTVHVETLPVICNDDNNNDNSSSSSNNLDKRLFQCGSQEDGLVKYDKYTCKQDNVQANLESVQCRVFQICKVFDYQYCKSRSRDPFPTPLT